MPAGLFAFMILFFMGCASTERPKPVSEQQEPFNYPVCKAGEFSGSGIGESESEALSEAHSALSRQINSSVKVTSERMASQQISGGKENLSSSYESRTLIESALSNAHDARIASKNKTGNKINIAVCMSKSDAAKGFLERQRLIADSLELASNTALKTGHPKRKNEAWAKAQTLWNELARMQSLLDGWGVERASFYEPASEIYSEAREDYKEYCRNMKIHWEPERESEYSSIAFSMLSKNLKMEKTACQGSGISLVYKYAEPDCSYKFGLYNCSYKASLLLGSCGRIEYLSLENSVDSIHKKQELALEKLRNNLKTVDFWEKWEREIQQWSPKCE